MYIFDIDTFFGETRDMRNRLLFFLCIVLASTSMHAQDLKSNAEYNARQDSLRQAFSAILTEWNEKMAAADEEAAGIVSSAVESANRQSSAILGETKERADRMISRARAEAEAERRQAEDDIKAQIADVSVILAGKILDREINAEDHSDLINSFISEIGDDYEGDE